MGAGLLIGLLSGLLSVVAAAFGVLLGLLREAPPLCGVRAAVDAPAAGLHAAAAAAATDDSGTVGTPIRRFASNHSANS